MTVSIDDLVRVFNTAVISTRGEEFQDFSTELHVLMESPAFKAILNAIRQLSRAQGIPEREAAEAVISTFRKIDKIWCDYVFQEGIDRLRSKS